MKNERNVPRVRFKGFTDALPAGRQAGNSWYTYVLRCDNGTLYKGKTNDMQRRLNDHINGTGAKYTKEHKPVALVYVKEFATEREAVEHEKYLKSGSGREWLKSLLEKEGKI